MTVAELLCRISSAELGEQMAYDRLELQDRRPTQPELQQKIERMFPA